MELENRILKCLQPILKTDYKTINKITDDLNLYSLGLTSLNHMDFLVSLEEEFDIVFVNEELLLDNFITLGRVKNIVAKKI